MRVREIMTQDVQTVALDKKTLIAEEIMNWACVRHVPVVDRQRRVVGIITHRDLLRVSISALDTSVARLEKAQHASMIPIEDVMQREVRVISPDSTVRMAAKIMREERLGCLPVVEKNELVGIVTEADLLRVLETLPWPVETS